MSYNMLHRARVRDAPQAFSVYVLRVKTHTYDDRNVYACGMLVDTGICSVTTKVDISRMCFPLGV